jgi:hypothetical protein
MTNDISITWRDLPLTAAQALDMERLESRWIENGTIQPGENEGHDHLIGIAKYKIAAAEAAERFAHVPIPPGDPCVMEWEPVFGGGWTRQLSWGCLDGGAEDNCIDVEVAGEQEPSGAFTRAIMLTGRDGERFDFTVEQARRLAANLQVAADVMDEAYYDGLTTAQLADRVEELEKVLEEVTSEPITAATYGESPLTVTAEISTTVDENDPEWDVISQRIGVSVVNPDPNPFEAKGFSFFLDPDQATALAGRLKALVLLTRREECDDSE